MTFLAHDSAADGSERRENEQPKHSFQAVELFLEKEPERPFRVIVAILEKLTRAWNIG